MSEMTEQQAIALGESEFWKDMEPEEIARFQLHTELLCMPFSVFHEAVEIALDRPVWTHEFANPKKLMDELNGKRPPPDLREILELIPEDKRVVILEDPDDERNDDGRVYR